MKQYLGGGLSMEERVRRLREIFGLADQTHAGLSKEALEVIEKEAAFL